MSLRPVLCLVAALFALPSTSFADSNGSVGSVASLTVYESSSDNYAMANGVLTIKEKATGTLRNYKWGGSICPGRTVSANSLALLFDALRSKDNVDVVPSYKAGNGNERCLTGFKLERVEPISLAPR